MTATWELRRCVPVESSRFERRKPEKLGYRRRKVQLEAQPADWFRRNAAPVDQGHQQ